MRKKIALLCAIIMMVTTIMPSFTVAEGEKEAQFKIETSADCKANAFCFGVWCNNFWCCKANLNNSGKHKYRSRLGENLLANSRFSCLV